MFKLIRSLIRENKILRQALDNAVKDVNELGKSDLDIITYKHTSNQYYYTAKEELYGTTRYGLYNPDEDI